ncbi:DUF3597 family protein [Lederbergia lenta]|uniref:DUF3597 family protein n=1 Tax=Lederbergia lenta TaxID=1467 RepID=UPI002040FCEB|nr:DUF3597 family protein [Lederbergia lenta]MCM3111087.1 DUF3597 family protein [Lederbergia lenta]
MTIKQQLVSTRSNTYGESNPCNYITIHETANYSKGAGAQVHANLQSNGYSASWHYQVDDKAVIQSFPDNVQCWHAGDGRGKGNLESIAIEICVNLDSDFKKAVENAVELVKNLMIKHNIPLNKVVQHNHWSGKDCPHNLRNGYKGVNWNTFIDFVKRAPKGNKPVTVMPPTTEKGPAQSKPSASKPLQMTTMKSESIVDWMKANKMDSSYANRATLAAQQGIKDYKGTAAQNITLLSKLKKEYKPKTTTSKSETIKSGSVVDYMNSEGMNSSFANRKKLAGQYGIKNYSGTAAQNITLLNKLKNSKSVSKPKNEVKTNSIVDWMKTNHMDSSYTNRAKLAQKYGISGYKGTAAQNIVLLNKLKDK